MKIGYIFSDIHKKILNLEYIMVMQNRMKQCKDQELNKIERIDNISTSCLTASASTLFNIDEGLKNRTVNAPTKHRISFLH